jgi:hypothetical protein
MPIKKTSCNCHFSSGGGSSAGIVVVGGGGTFAF